MKNIPQGLAQVSAISPRQADKRFSGAFLRIALYLLALAMPLVLAKVFRPITDHSIVYEMGKGFALLGYTILALQFVVAGRSRWIEKPFGLDIILQFHRYMGTFAAILLLMHPLFLAAGDQSWSILIGTDKAWYIWIGRIVLIILFAQGILSGFRRSLKMEYQKWLRVHNLLALIILAAGFLHSWFAGGDMAMVSMRILWAGFFILAGGVYLNRKVFHRRQLSRQLYRVVDVIQETPDVWTIKMAPSAENWRIEFLPGQFHYITLYRNSNLPAEEHPFTISSCPTQKSYICSTIKRSGDYTATIPHTRPGDLAAVHGPFGYFSYLLYPEETDLVFIAGGVGITPLMSMIRHMRNTRRRDIRVLLLYANRKKQDIIFYEELTEIEKSEFPDLQVFHILSRPEADWDGETGRLNGEKIHHICGCNLQEKSFYLCGPPQMARQIIKELLNAGVSHARIHFENFSF